MRRQRVGGDGQGAERAGEIAEPRRADIVGDSVDELGGDDIAGQTAHRLGPDQAECIVTSAEKHLTTGVQEGVIAFAGGSARKGNVFYGADNNGIGVAPCYQFDGNVITDDIKAKVQAAYDGMASGDIDPCQPTNLCYAGKEDKGT